MRIARDSNISRRLASSSPSVECKLSQPRIPRVASAPTGPGRRVPTPARAPGRADRPVALDFDRDVPRRRAREKADAARKALQTLGFGGEGATGYAAKNVLLPLAYADREVKATKINFAACGIQWAQGE